MESVKKLVDVDGMYELGIFSVAEKRKSMMIEMMPVPCCVPNLTSIYRIQGSLLGHGGKACA